MEFRESSTPSSGRTPRHYWTVNRQAFQNTARNPNSSSKLPNGERIVLVRIEFLKCKVLICQIVREKVPFIPAASDNQIIPRLSRWSKQSGLGESSKGELHARRSCLTDRQICISLNSIDLVPRSWHTVNSNMINT